MDIYYINEGNSLDEEEVEENEKENEKTKKAKKEFYEDSL